MTSGKLNFHNKRKYNWPASDGKEKILPQGRFNLGPDDIDPIGNIRCYLIYNLQNHALSIFEQVTAFGLKDESVGNELRSVNNHAGFFVKCHGHRDHALF